MVVRDGSTPSYRFPLAPETSGLRRISTIDAGTYKFKKQWGAEPVPLHWEYWLPGNAALPELRPDAPKFRLAVAAWQRLPVSIANRIGPAIVKNLP